MKKRKLVYSLPPHQKNSDLQVKNLSSRQRLWCGGFLFFLTSFSVLVWFQVFILSDQNLHIFFFDVGQGDAILFKKGNTQILIDGGPNNKILEKLSGEMPPLDRKIEAILLTHPDSDHLTGLTYVLKNFEVKNILLSGASKETEIFKRWQELIKEEKAKVFEVRRGDKIELDNVVIDIFSPDEALALGKNTNNSSVVAKVFYGESYFLIPGDIESGVEDQLLQNNFDLKGDVLKIAHHGSKLSSGKDFLAAVGPEYAVISLAKDNKFGFPTKEVLENLKNIKVLRTDLNGDIEFVSDGSNVSLK